MKKWVLCILAVICIAGVGISCFPKAPQDEQLTYLLQKAEGIYGLGFDSNFEIGKGELMLRDTAGKVVAYYDEILNYEKTVSEVFTENGIKELENSGYVTLPRFLKKDGKIYRVSNILNSRTLYLQNISSIRLIDRTWNTFTYEAEVVPIHEQLAENQVLEPMTIPFSVRIQNGKLKMESFEYPDSIKEDGGYTQEELDSFKFE